MHEADLQIRRLDDPQKIFFFSSTQVIVCLMFFVVGSLVNMTGIGGGIGIVVAWGLSKTGQKHHRAFWKHCMYWFMPGKAGLKWLPESAQRLFLR